jgi:hypothetical protein
VHGGFEIARVGGSNGNAHISKEFFQMLHLPGITPRKSCGVMWYPIGTKWLFLYVSPYKKKHTLSCRSYPQPMPGGQVRITKKKLLDSQCPAYLRTALEQFVAIKAESPELVSSLNRLFVKPKFGILACADANVVQLTTNCIACQCAKRNPHTADPDEYFLHLLTSCSFSIVAYATRLHVDTPRHHPFLPYQGFWENKWVVDIPLQGINDLDQPALGQGGVGHGRFTFAILNHCYNLCDAYGWGNCNESGNGVLFQELVRVTREHNIPGPDAPDIPVLFEEHLESVEI